MLLDSGASETCINKSLVKKFRRVKTEPMEWKTAAGTLKTENKVRAYFTLPEFYEKKVIMWDSHVFQNTCNYDMIIGRDLLTELEFEIDFKRKLIKWDEAHIPMKSYDATPKDMYIQDPENLTTEYERIKGILDAKYEAADIDKITENCTHLNKIQRKELKQLLEKHKSLFDGTLGKWKNEKLKIELKEGVKPYHSRAYPIPKAYELTLKMEVERLCELGVLKKVNRSEWGAPTFIIPKKDKTVRFISDFRELNKRLKRKPFPIPKIQDLMMKLEGFMYGTSLDLNMGYYHIELCPDSKKLCTIVLPFGKYEYQRLPMGLSNSPDIFQEKMSTLMHDLEYVRAYIDDLLIISKGSWTDHLEKLDEVMSRLEQAGLKVNAKKSFFGRPELEYLGYWITRNGIQPLPNKIKAILDLETPKTTKQVRKFVGMINYYRDMWAKRSETLAPLSKLCSKKTKFKWTEVEQQAFNEMKRIIAKEVLLTYPDFNKKFIIHTDASAYQLGACISQDGKPIAFYSRKLTDAQTRYTTTERELLAIVETLKEFRNILLGQQIVVYTDHKNLTYKEFNTDRVMRWRLILEEYSPEIIYIKGPNNVVADALSRLPIKENNENKNNNNTNDLGCINNESYSNIIEKYAELFSTDNNEIVNPIDLKLIQSEQQKDKALIELAKRDKNQFSIKNFRGGGKVRSLICFKNKIVIPKALQLKITQWYHTYLCHPGLNRTEETIRQNFTWNNLRKTVHDVCSTCPTCQKTKRSSKHYGHLPPKEAEVSPWEKLCVDLVGPYTIKNKNNETITIHAVTMIDPATGWFEMKLLKEKSAINVANLVEQTWLTRYPWPQEITYDQGTEFMAEFADMVEYDYNIKKRPATTRNPQANSIIERAHQTMGNMLRTFELSESEVSEDMALEGIISAIMFGLRATYHTTLQATPAQLVFGRDAMLNIKFEADWKRIKDRKQQLINKNNMKENSKRIKHQYNVGDKVLVDIKYKSKSKYGLNPFDGPYDIIKVNNNGTVVIKKGAVLETINIRQIKPYKT